MVILEKEVLLKLAHSSIQYYESLGYEIPRHLDKQRKLRFTTGSQILVKIEHLTKQSHVELTKICDECGKYMPNQKYSNIVNSRKNTDGKDRCKECGQLFASSKIKNNTPYKRSLEYHAKENDKEYLLKEFSNKNIKKPSEITYGSADMCLWNCPNCKTEYTMRVCSRTIGNANCPYCAGTRVNITNCLWTTHPDVARLLKDPQRGYEVTAGRNSKEDLVCSDCNFTNTKTISSVVYNGFSCSQCSDGISYPEKFIMNMLSQLDIAFKPQKVFRWAKGKRYDVYIENLNCIIEIHGAQHYIHVNGFNRTLKEEQENDKLKEKLAIENGIEIYVIIDTRESDMEYIKNRVFESRLSRLFNLSKVNWLQCHDFAFNTSFLRIVCDLWNGGINRTEEICQITKLGKPNLIRYLKQGARLGMCDYDPDKIKKQTAIKNAVYNKREIVQLTTDNEFIKFWESISEASSKNGIGFSNISNVLTGRNLTAGGFKWVYKKDYDELVHTQVNTYQ